MLFFTLDLCSFCCWFVFCYTLCSSVGPRGARGLTLQIYTFFLYYTQAHLKYSCMTRIITDIPSMITWMISDYSRLYRSGNTIFAFVLSKRDM